MVLLFKGTIYRCELMHYLTFHPLNQVDLPASLDIFRVGGRRIEWDSGSSQYNIFCSFVFNMVHMWLVEVKLCRIIVVAEKLLEICAEC